MCTVGTVSRRQCIRSLCLVIKIFWYNELSSEFSFQCPYKDCVNYNASKVKHWKRTNLSLYRLWKSKEKTPSSVPCESCYVNREHSLQGTKSKVCKRSTKRLKLSYGQSRSKCVQLEHESSTGAAEATVREKNYLDNQL